jgi:hypothetical protein
LSITFPTEKGFQTYENSLTSHLYNTLVKDTSDIQTSDIIEKVINSEYHEVLCAFHYRNENSWASLNHPSKADQKGKPLTRTNETNKFVKTVIMRKAVISAISTTDNFWLLLMLIPFLI